MDVDFGVNVVGKILKKGGEKIIQCDTCDSKKNNIAVGRRACTRTCAYANGHLPARCEGGRGINCAECVRQYCTKCDYLLVIECRVDKMMYERN